MTLRPVKRASDLHPKAAGPKPQAVVWSAMGDDRDTKLSVQLLTGKGASVTVNTLDHNPTLKTQFTTAYPTQKTLPYIVVDNVAIGGFKDLVNNPTYSMKAPPKAAAPVVKPTKFGKGSGVTPIASGTTVRNSVAAPKKKK
jgi:hypothetical protein